MELVAYIRRGLSTEGNLRFKIDSASLIVESKFTISQALFRGETTGGVAKRGLFSQAMAAFENGLSVSSVKTANLSAY